MTDPSTSSGGDSSRRDHKRLDTLFKALAATQRRRVVRYFQQTDDDVASVDDLIDFAIDIEAGSTEASRVQLETKYHHATLPKLADLGVIEYDARSRTVRYCGSPTLERVLTVNVEESQPAE